MFKLSDQPKALPSCPVTNAPTRGTRNFKKPHVGGRVFCIDTGEASEDPNAILASALLIKHLLCLCFI